MMSCKIKHIVMKILVNVFALTLFFLISTYSVVFGQTISIRGKLFEKETGKVISNGLVNLNPGKLSTIANGNGEYFFSCSNGQKQISTQVFGYKPIIINFNADSDTIINVYLEVLPFELAEVTVTGEQIKNIRMTQHGTFVITPTAVHEIPRLFSEPDLLKSLQLMPGVLAGKDGSSDIYVRGGGAGQNIILANGCYFFLPGHFLGMVSPIDLDFLETSELFKDYFPAELGGGASSVISLRFKEPKSDSLQAQLRLGMLSSGFTAEKQFKKLKLDVAAGLKRGNYSIYAPILRKIGSNDVSEFLPSDNYAFYDGFINISHLSKKIGKIEYLFFGNYDKGKDENEIRSMSLDTVISSLDVISTGWKSVVHAVHWESPKRNSINWKLDVNYNKLEMDREIFHKTDKSFHTELFDVVETSYSFSPIINVIGSSLMASGGNQRFNWTVGIADRIKQFSPNINSSIISYDQDLKRTFGETTIVHEMVSYFSSSYHLTNKLLLDAGLRLSGAFLGDASFITPEPRLRLSFNINGPISPHFNYVRLSQLDHSVEGSNAGLRTMLWLPVTKDFGPEISDVVSAGFYGQIDDDFAWSLDGYYKLIEGMVDYKSGASFVYDTSFVDLLETVNGKAYGVEAGLIKGTGNMTGSLSYTWSKSKQEFHIAEGMIWIPSSADRPHNFNLALKYHLKTGTSFGLNWVFQSGAPATMYEQETSYGEFFDIKNNIRYFDYHRMDVSIRQKIYKRKFSIFLEADIYNAYNRKNTFYFKKSFDFAKNRYYFKNISLFPIMPSLTLTIKY